MADAGFSCGADYAEITQKHSIERGAECARALLERKVDAIFVSDNTLTMGAVIELNRQHISIPDQVSIIGYDNFDWMDLMTPPLTTVKQQAYQMGYVAAEMVMRKLNGMDAEEHITMKTQLILRGSHGKTTKD